MAPSEVQADLDFNLDRLSLPTEPERPFHHGLIPPLVCLGGAAYPLHRTEARIGPISASKYENPHAAACCHEMREIIGDSVVFEDLNELMLGRGPTYEDVFL